MPTPWITLSSVKKSAQFLWVPQSHSMSEASFSSISNWVYEMHVFLEVATSIACVEVEGNSQFLMEDRLN